MPGRKIEVQLVGDASDLERSLAGALASLKAFGAASDSNGNKITKLGADGERAGKRLDYAFQGAVRSVEKFGAGLSGPYGILKPVGLLVQGWAKLTDIVGQGAKQFEQMAQPLEQIGTEGGQAVGMFASMGTTLAPLLGLVAPLAAGLVAVGGALLILPALAAAATFALVALLDVVTTLSAIVAGFVAPLTLLAALVGGLAGAFYLGGKAALSSQNGFAGLQHRVEQLGGEFKHFTRDLGHLFLPYFWQLAAVAQTALTYFDKLSKMNLGQAFHSLSTTGVAMLSKFVYGVAHVLANPFKLAIRVAFDSSAMASAVSSWWTSFTHYLFGYSKTKFVKIGFGRVLLEQKDVKGALQPIINWFSRQHFTKTGLRWANEIINGITNGPSGKNLAKWAGTVANHAGHIAGRAFVAAIEAEITAIGPWMVKFFEEHWRVALNPSPFAALAVGIIEAKIGSAFDWLKSKAEGIWDSIVSYIESHIPTIGIHLSVPSLPSFHIPGTSYSLPHTGGLIGAFGTRGYAAGGLVMGGVPGRDSVPAMLTPGEMVLTRGQQMALLHGGAGATTVQVFIGEEQLEQRMYKVVRADNRKTARALQAQRAWGG